MSYESAQQTLSADAAAPYLAKLRFAEEALRIAKVPPKFVTNFCFSPHGTAPTSSASSSGGTGSTSTRQTTR